MSICLLSPDSHCTIYAVKEYKPEASRGALRQRLMKKGRTIWLSEALFRWEEKRSSILSKSVTLRKHGGLSTRQWGLRRPGRLRLPPRASPAILGTSVLGSQQEPAMSQPPGNELPISPDQEDSEALPLVDLDTLPARPPIWRKRIV